MPWGSRNHPFRETESIYCFIDAHSYEKSISIPVTPMFIYPYAKNNFAAKYFLELLEFQGS